MASASILCVGPLLVDHLHFSTGVETYYPGGNATIFASVAGHLGVQVAVAGQVGADANGESVRSLLRSHGVDTSSLRTLSGLATKIAEILVEPDGRYRRLNSRPDLFPYFSDVDPMLLESTNHLHLSGLNALLRACEASTLRLIGIFHQRALPITVGLTRSSCDPAVLRRALTGAEVVFCNANELMDLMSVPELGNRTVRDLLATCSIESCVVTLGRDGVMAKWRGEIVELRAPPLLAVNSLGAGDVFSAAFMHGVLSGFQFERTLSSAVVAASRSVEHSTWDHWLQSAIASTSPSLAAVPAPWVQSPAVTRKLP